MAANILHIDQRHITLAQHATMNGTGAEIQAWCGVDRPCQGDKPGRLQARRSIQHNGAKPFHHIAIGGAFSASAGPHLAFHLGLKIGLTCSAHDDDTQIVIMIDTCNAVIGMQHILIEEITDSQFRRPVANGHRGDNFLFVQKQRQWLFCYHGQGHCGPVFINAGDRLRQPRRIRVRGNQHCGGVGGVINHAPKMKEAATFMQAICGNTNNFAFHSRNRYPAATRR